MKNGENKISSWSYSLKESKKTKIIGYEKYENKLFPIIECSKREDIDFGLKFYCVFCKRYHLHGEGDGHRAAHCINDKSPFMEDGYVLKLNENNKK